MAVLASSVPPRPAVPQPHAPCPAVCLPGHAEGLYRKARSPTCPLCQFVVKTSSRLTSMVISQARQRALAVSGGCRGPCPSCCTQGSQCVPKRAKLLKDKSGAALTGIIDEETMAAPHWSALAFPDLRQAPPHITTFHLPQPARERCCPRLPVVEQRLRETEKLSHTSLSGTGQRLWRALGESADVKAAYPSPWRRKASLLETNNLEHQGRRDKNIY